MTTSTSQPKWATPDRKLYLLKLWSLFGNQCLLGHKACPIFSHYVSVKPEVAMVAKPISVLCRDREGNPSLDSEGKQLILTLYKAVPVLTEKKTLTRLYDLKAEQAIIHWIADDREFRQALWEAELKAIHSLGERSYPLRGQFSAISKDIFHQNQPLYYFDGQAISGVTLTPFVRVRIASSYVRLYIDLGEALREVSKNKRRQAVRYGKPLPIRTEEKIRHIILEAVRHYLAH